MIRDIELLRTPGYQDKLARCIHCGLFNPGAFLV